jgi:hypothetical protein
MDYNCRIVASRLAKTNLNEFDSFVGQLLGHQAKILLGRSNHTHSVEEQTFSSSRIIQLGKYGSI